MGIIALLDRRVEAVHVDMYDLSNRGRGHGPNKFSNDAESASEAGPAPVARYLPSRAENCPKVQLLARTAGQIILYVLCERGAEGPREGEPMPSGQPLVIVVEDDADLGFG